jgi:hypothetical protein
MHEISHIVMSKYGAMGDRAARHALRTALPEDSLSSLGKDTDCFMLSVVILSFLDMCWNGAFRITNEGHTRSSPLRVCFVFPVTLFNFTASRKS